MLNSKFECFLMKIDFKGLNVDVGVCKDNTKIKKDILLLHGLGSDAYEFYERMAVDIPNERLCAIDWLGHGKATKLFREEDTYDARYMASYLSVVIDNLIKNQILEDKFYIIAKSMSAIPLAYLYNDYKNNFEKIILVTPAGFDKKMGYVFAFFSRVITKSIILSWLCSFWIPKKRPRKVLQNNLKIKDWGKIVSKYAKAGYDIFGNMKSTHVVAHKYKLMDKDILFICGEKDMIFPRRDYVNFAIENNHQISILLSEEHSFKRENFEKLDEVIKKFIGIR